jgi:hypothetical protein
VAAGAAHSTSEVDGMKNTTVTILHRSDQPVERGMFVPVTYRDEYGDRCNTNLSFEVINVISTAKLVGDSVSTVVEAEICLNDF